MESFELVALKNGLMSLRSLEFGETFHPVTGPLGEAQILHVGQQNLLERSRTQGKFVLWDVGLGAAANSLAAVNALGPGDSLEIHSFEKTLDPLLFALEKGGALEYIAPHQGTLRELMSRGEVFTEGLRWRLHLGDFRDFLEPGKIPAPHGIFYDPYSPGSNPELWGLEHFKRIHSCLDPTVPCLLTNYTRSTSVRTTLLMAGFFVGFGRGVGEKEQTTVASNCLSLLEHPLENLWLERVKVSGNAAPIRKSYLPGPITEKDLMALRNHPQFL